MRHVLAVVDDAGGASGVIAVAGAMAEVLRADVREVRLAVGSGGRDVETAVLHELEQPGTILGVLADGTLSGDVSWRVVRRSTKPVILLPSRPRTPESSHKVISRVLLPLDGSPEAAAAVTETAGLFTRTGVDLVVLHVFDEVTTPRCWDQAAHARQAWEEEFLARHCAHPGVRMELRSGVVEEQVVNVAVEEYVDLITLGWSRQIGPGRARTVRRIVADADVPVMLIPMTRDAAPPPPP